ncbi:4'-phosphopantetheinyl transferase family protein [Kitasatospora sp. NPDC054795]
MSAQASPLAGRVTVVLVRTGPVSAAAARARVLSAAAEEFGSARPLRLGHEPGGRPRLHGLGPRVQVSLSHGRGFAALAVGTGEPLGVDLEVIRPVPAERLAARWFTATESAWICRQRPDERAGAYFWIWTQKEAAGKARGTGLSAAALRAPVPLPACWPPPPGDGLRLRRSPDGLRRGGRIPVPGVLLSLAAVAGPTPAPPVDLRLRLDTHPG